MKHMNPYELTIQTIQEAGEMVLNLREEQFVVSMKGGDPKDIVTSVDTEVNAFIIGKIKAAFPEHAIYSEEGGGNAETSVYQWAIDPIDGSSNFSRAIPHFAVCISLLESGIPVLGAVYNPVTRELFSFEKGKGAQLNGVPIHVSSVTTLKEAHVFFRAGRKDSSADWGGESYRRLLKNVNKTSNLGGSALDACFVAAGRLEANVYGTLATLDIAGAVGILLEAGGVVCDSKGEQLTFTRDAQRIYMANNSEILGAIRTLLEAE